MEQDRKPGTWKKGDPSPNPGGRPKGLARMLRAELEAIRQEMRTSLNAGPDGEVATEVMNGYRALFHRLWGIAMTGEDKDSLVAIKILYERTDGAPRQVVEHETPKPRAVIDWRTPPPGWTLEQWAQRRRELLAAHEELRLLAHLATTEPDGSVEH